MDHKSTCYTHETTRRDSSTAIKLYNATKLLCLKLESSRMLIHTTDNHVNLEKKKKLQKFVDYAITVTMNIVRTKGKLYLYQSKKIRDTMKKGFKLHKLVL